MPASPEQPSHQPRSSEPESQASLSSPILNPTTVHQYFDTNKVRYAARFVYQLPQPLQVRGPQEVGDFLHSQVFHPWEAFTQEEMHGLTLNTHGEITHSYLIYRGTIDLIAVRPAEVFRPALLLNAVDIILAHNHPANDTSPSLQDITATKDIIVAGNALGMQLIDHMIVGKDECVSLKERGLGAIPWERNTRTKLRIDPQLE